MSARWQDEEDKTDRRFRYFGIARASQVTAKATILYGSTGHVPHTIANIYYPERSGYFKEYKPSSESVSIQEPNLWYAKKAPVYEHENTNPCGTTEENNQNMSSRKMWGPTCPVFILPYPAR